MSNGVTPVVAEPILTELSRVLESAEFRASKRCQEFIRYVIVETLEGRADSLKERTIGVDLLGQSPNYDSSANATVRVRANEVRKRLKQYYSDPAHLAEVRIDLPCGSYVPEFHTVTSQAPAAPAVRPPRRLYAWLTVALLAALIAGLSLWAYSTRPTSALERFWGPARHSGRPLLVCMDYVQAHRVARPFGPDDTIPGHEIVPVVNEVVGAGGIHAISALTAMLTRMGVEVDIKIGSDTSFGDLRHSPVVVMGCYNNRWSTLMYDGLRFGFSNQEGFSNVEERKAPHRRWPAFPTARREDGIYGVISRVVHPTTGSLMLGIAGISHLGTRGVAEFATNATLMQRVLAQAPAGWEKKNMQIVLQVPVIANTPAPARVVALECW
ncbi:MAG TPA: hypothetical protein VN442_05965 [Bryobacteraceae bacterium]|nr:hypothetical protein [Bryobacteraceae bacterium]